MEKIDTSLACQFCGSSNVQCSLQFCDEEKKVDETLEAVITTKHRVYKCQCNDCKKNYVVDHGIDKFILFKNPCQVTEAGDVKLLAEYESQSKFVHGYKICSIVPSYCDNNTSKEETYLILTDGDEYPIVLQKQDVDSIIDKPDKVKSLTKNTFFNRYR